MKKSSIAKLFILCTLAAFSSCASKKAITNTSPTTSVKGDAKPMTSAQQKALKSLMFVQKISDNQVYAKNIVGSMNFNVQTGDKDISVPGSVHMRKDEMIRLQLFVPLLGTEIGRLEFTPTYVLVIDRFHKEYVKADYNQLDFLKDNGLTFYSLQALFWNQILLPGKQNVTESDLKKFTAETEIQGMTVPVTLTNGNIKYTWNADKSSARITATDVIYSSAKHGTSTLNWYYSNFKNVGVKMFPAQQSFQFFTTADAKKRKTRVTIKMNEVKNDANWDTKTTISDKYKRVEASDVFEKIINL